MWQYEGDFTLYDLMQRKDWPYNLEPLLFGQSLDGPRTAQRRIASLRVVMQQVQLPGRETRPGRMRSLSTPAGWMCGAALHAMQFWVG